eukprot:gnl/Ergobibamus_cyprinoides/255.p2 GENE.gnl/Ergobibamus_cyprinoides/255~~gnl/Ergobibamus_cyprinoides/255.p2  ORF type:complete len:226 (+),score=44.23 gnl/Ergobibamus_cyprinoides/255:631-1308(+)
MRPQEAQPEDEWITPENISQFTDGAQTGGDLPSDRAVCLTGDLAMQNVLLQIGLAVVAPDGKRVTALKTFVQKCHGCLSICNDMTRAFCPKCGGQTLMKVSVTVDKKGVPHYSRGIKTFSLRGTKFALPTPKPGKSAGPRAEVPILREDQGANWHVQQRRKQKAERRQAQTSVTPSWAGPGADADGWFSAAIQGPSSEKVDLHSVPQWKRRNPNEARHRHDKRKK